MSEELNNTMNLNSISDQGSLKKRKRVGRGMGSGLGKTAGRGHNCLLYTSDAADE